MDLLVELFDGYCGIGLRHSNAKNYSEKVSIIAKFVASSIGRNLHVVDILATNILIGMHHGISSASRSCQQTKECIRHVDQCARMI